jgi:long-chain acyl-CoA synthetase
VGKLNDGTMFAPKYLENKLKFFPQIKEVVAFGDGRDFATAFLNIDLEAVGSWAERNHLAYTGYTDLAGRPEVSAMVMKCVEQVNRDLSEDPRLSNSQIKRFLILPKELDADDGELTRTRKVRRRFIFERYGDLVEALYSERPSIDVDLEVKFEDGRVGRLQADVKIHDAETFGMTEFRKAS